MNQSVTVDDAEFGVELARTAGDLLLRFRAGFEGQSGDDERAVARALRDAADAESQAYLGAELAARRPDDAVLSEEAADSAERDKAERVWIIDPLDGTWEYGLGRDDWAVHVALWERAPDPHGQLLLGVVALPDEDVVFTSAFPPRLPRLDLSRPLRIIASRSRPPAILDRVAEELAEAWADLGGPAEAEVVQVGSVGAKVARLLTGRAEVYLHDTGFYEWDVAAPYAVAQAAGFAVAHIDGTDVTFNHRPPYVTSLMVARPELVAAVAAAVGSSA
jgi:3'(2'), 5'-bisphosphate nucleotidase